jgi:hypothetical protein
LQRILSQFFQRVRKDEEVVTDRGEAGVAGLSQADDVGGERSLRERAEGIAEDVTSDCRVSFPLGLVGSGPRSELVSGRIDRLCCLLGSLTGCVCRVGDYPAHRVT